MQQSKLRFDVYPYAESVSHGAERIYLSPPKVDDADIESVLNAIKSGWLAPVGPELEEFEKEVAHYLRVGHAVALTSGTAALHLGLKEVGVVPGDAVLLPTLTFAATAFATAYLGAEPIFVDVDESWNMDPELTKQAISNLRQSGRAIGAAIPVDLYGSPANYADLLAVLQSENIPVIEDAAEGLGAIYGDRKVGTFGHASVLSFNGNKMITTSGGGMLVTDDERIAQRVRFLSSQAREAQPWYEHKEIGFNYRLSNVLAALGRSQLRRIDEEVERRRAIREKYRSRLGSVPGVQIQLDPPWGSSNAWLSVVTFDSALYPDAPRRVRTTLDQHRIEARHVWKPMHQQPVFSQNLTFLNGRSDQVFRDGLCLPSGTALDERDLDRISDIVIGCLL